MQRVKIWDVFVRLNHWLMVALVVALWWTAEQGEMERHLQLAGILGGLIVARILWGLFGSESARFSRFVKGPAAVVEHFKELGQGQYQPGNTHNAAGGWAVVALLLVLLVQFTTGLFADDEIFFSGPLASAVSGDLSDFLTGIHKDNFNVLIAVVVLHVVAIILYRLRGINLVAAMIHGKREGVAAPRLVNAWWAIVAAAALATAFYFFIN